MDRLQNCCDRSRFARLATARDFFTDNIFSLDSLVMTDGLERQFKLEFDMRFANTHDGFGFDFLVGNRNQMASLSAFSAVPEPTAIPALIGFAGAVLLRRRRR
ncbi:MAG: PEP-CTERM sorting domain-containing protein [Planctomycetaceae bacterium]|nr:PEP-CTERM sorting domain-containing protein [Planctomycetaceae bacterium]